MAMGDCGRDGGRKTYGMIGEKHEHEGPSIGGSSALGTRTRGQVSGDALDDAGQGVATITLTGSHLDGRL